MAIATDASNNVFVTGFYRSDSLRLGNLPPLAKPVSQDIYIVKYNSAGDELWAKSANGTGQLNQSQGLATDATGNVFVTGYFGKGTIQFGTTPTLTGTGSWNPYIAKYDGNGTALWAKGPTGCESYDIVSGISTDASGNAYIVGIMNGKTLQFGNLTPLTKKDTTPKGDVYIVKYDANI